MSEWIFEIIGAVIVLAVIAAAAIAMKKRGDGKK